MRRLSRRSGTAARADLLGALSEAAVAGARLVAGSAYSPLILQESGVLSAGIMSASLPGMEKRVVYIIRSDADANRHYVGITSDVAARLDWHNHGPCGHTISHRPWSLVVSIEFPTERAAVRFETYLKSGSGRAFAKRHFSVVTAHCG